jgi:hypothetical protein
MTPLIGRPRRSWRALLAALGLILALPVTAVGGDDFAEPTASMVVTTGAVPGTTFVPLINSGDVAFGETFSGLPDGIGAVPRKNHFPEWLPFIGHNADYVDLYVNHEESHVPFGTTPTTVFADFQDSSVTRVRIDTDTHDVVEMEVVLPGSAGFIRFCSSFMAGPREGFPFYTLLLNEESNDVVPVPPGAVYGPDPSASGGRQAGYAAWFNTVTGKYDVIAGAGRHNHENTVVVPGGWPFKVVSLSGDDTFTSTSSPTRPNLSQLYLFSGRTWLDYTRDRGTLYGFQVTATHAGPVDPMSATNGANDYFEIAPGMAPWKGRFIPVPESVARGTDPSVLPQDALEDWSNANNVFQFIRVEDLAYDPDDPTVVYFADTGERRAVENPATGRLMRAPSGTMGPYPNGRIFKLVLDPDDPKKVLSFSILLDADAGGYDNLDVMHQPDNIDTSGRSLMVQEDSSQAPNSRIWRYDLVRKTWTVVASVLDSSWESSGIVDASAAFGKGTWLVDVQGHGDFVDVDTTSVPGVTLKRESGQLLLLRLPGS